MERGALFDIKREKFKGGTPMKKGSTEEMEKSSEKKCRNTYTSLPGEGVGDLS